MNAFIETLEGRQMLSVSHPVLVGAYRETMAIHMAPVANQAMVFQGQSLNSDGSFDSDVQMALTPAAGGTYNVRITVINTDGGVTNLAAKLDATGHFALTHKDGNGTTQVQGQMSDDKQSFTANWSSTNANGNRSGTAALMRTTIPIAKTTGVRFAGTGLGSDGGRGRMTAFVLQTSNGYWVSMQATSPKGESGGILLSMDPTGNINYSGPNDGGQITVTAQLVGAILSGAWSTQNSDGSAGGGATFTLHRI